MTPAGRLAGAAGAALCALALLAAAPPTTAAAAPSSFMTGFADGVYLTSADPNTWFNRTVATGAQFVLLPVSWAAISPGQPPAGTNPSDPANPAYNWGGLDQAVRGAVAHGLTVAFTIAGAGGPAWADGPGRPSWAQPGTWKPNAAAFAAFAKAVARRYSGSFNPGDGVLPHVRYYQAWSEPNLYNHLTPQWVRVRGQWVAESAIIYRGLLNAFYAAVKSVNRSDVVITGGTAPYGNQPGPGNLRVPPAWFVRQLLCLHGQALSLEPCPDPAHFDILAHHPYEIGAPTLAAYNIDDVSVPDIWKLTRSLAVAERTGRALPRGQKQVWVTEFSWDSRPPDPQAVPIIERARWTEEAFYLLWRQGVDALAWNLIVDQPPMPNYASTYQSGLYYVNGRLKPGLEGFRFPFVVWPAGRGRAVVWGISPNAGTVLVRRHSSGGWRTMLRFAVNAHAIFTRTIALPGPALMRAQIDRDTSLAWSWH